MKRFFIMFAAIVAAFCLSSCSREQLEEMTPSNEGIQLDVKVANLDGSADTKAVKTGWVAGDKIDIWYDSNVQHALDLVIKYDGSKWDKDASAALSGNEPAASGKIKYLYEGYNDLSKYEKWSDAAYDGTLTLAFASDSANPASYSYSSGTLSFSIDNWLPLSEFQVVVTGIDPEKYYLRCNNLMLVSGIVIGADNISVSDQDYDEGTLGVSNADGAAFYFGYAQETAATDYVFTLRDIETGDDFVYTVSGKTHSPGSFTAIKIKSEKFFSSPEAVDLELSVKWATFNIGAHKPEQYGSYFAWGETKEKSNYAWKNEGDYEWGIYDSSAKPKYGMTKYTADVIGGDGLKTLLSGDDPATKNWGSKWRTPTIDEIKELLDKTKCEWTWDADKKGYTVRGLKTGNSIFLPAVGFRDGTELKNAGAGGDYWSSSVYESYPDYAYGFYFNSGGHDWSCVYRCCGFLVRAVTEY